MLAWAISLVCQFESFWLRVLVDGLSVAPSNLHKGLLVAMRVWVQTMTMALLHTNVGIIM